ncbi:MAG: hypothetical protein EOQ47_32370 [Mesorhizobium sp.]|nr:MAG: hypothetical protein EOQ47_32370 [Mesorhizobium sp.]
MSESKAGHAAFLRAPLCPAGHLPLKGGDWLSRRLSPTAAVRSLPAFGLAAASQTKRAASLPPFPYTLWD